MGNTNNPEKDDENHDGSEDDEVLQELSQYNYPIENAVFEGGGMKGLAYIGAVEVLHKTGVLKGIKRFAGVSSGAVTAALLAIGYTDISMFVKDVDLMSLINDDTCLSFVPSVLKRFGWNSAKAFDRAVNSWIEAKTGNPAITFKQLYDKSKVELCILTVNTNYSILEYCHPKTTPDLQIREALRMSVSIPVYVQPFKKQINGEDCYYLDGGVVCNLPIHAFDGWWLSMDPKDGFIRRLQPVSEVPEILETSDRFAPRNKKTIAFQVYSDDEDDDLRYFLENRPGITDIPYPDTKLSSSYLDEHKKTKIEREKLIEKHDTFKTAFEKLFKALEESGFIKEGKIRDTELKSILSDEKRIPKEDLLLLFNKDNVDTIIDHLDRDGDGQIVHAEFLHGAEELGCRILYRYHGYKYNRTTSFKSFLTAVYQTQQHYLKTNSLGMEDVDRVIGINTGYITTLASNLKDKDKKYVTAKGKIATIAFLKHLVSAEMTTEREIPNDRHQQNSSEKKQSDTHL